MSRIKIGPNIRIIPESLLDALHKKYPPKLTYKYAVRFSPVARSVTALQISIPKYKNLVFITKVESTTPSNFYQDAVKLTKLYNDPKLFNSLLGIPL